MPQKGEWMKIKIQKDQLVTEPKYKICMQYKYNEYEEKK